MDEKQISAVMSAMGRKGGKVRSQKQRETAMTNLLRAQLMKVQAEKERWPASADLKREEQV